MFQPHKGNSSPSLSTYRGRKYICMSSIMYKGFMGLCFDLLKLLYCCPDKISAIPIQMSVNMTTQRLKFPARWFPMSDDKCIKYLDALCCQSRYCEQMCHYCGTSLVLFLHSTDEWKQTEAKRGQFGSLPPLLSFRPISVSESPGSLWLRRDG